jgi:hypothetical protein
MWGRRFSSRRSGVGSGRRAYSYGTVVLAVSAAILLFLYLTGRLSF